MKKINWKYYERTTIEEHIKKHIFDIKEEIPFWKEKLINLEGLKSEYCKTWYKADTELYRTYDKIAKENIYNHGDESRIKTYIYKGSNGYSCNFSSLDDNLTTCTKISFNNEGKLSKCTILSCFFRNSFCIDSMIFPCLKNIPLKVNNRYCYQKDMFSNCQTLNLAKFLTFNYDGYNYLDITLKRWLLLFTYLVEQWKYYQESMSIKFENYSYTYYLMKALERSLLGNRIVDLNGIVEPSDFSKERDNVISKIKELKKMVGSLKSEIEYYAGEMSLLLICYYAMCGDIDPYIKDESDEVKENVYMIIKHLNR